MTSSLHLDAPSGVSSRRHFYLRRLHSLSGVVPIGVFLTEHLWTNAHAVYGRESFNHAVQDIQNLPLLAYIEVFGIALPLLFHALYGLVIVSQGGLNVRRYGWSRNWMYVLQRVSGLVAFAFLGLHVWQYRLQKLLHRMEWPDFYGHLERDLSAPGMYVIYFLGITAAVFHFANGLWLFGNSWGVTVSARSMRRAAALWGAFGLALWLLGINTLFHFSYRCGGFIPMPEQQVDTCQDPDVPAGMPVGVPANVAPARAAPLTGPAGAAHPESSRPGP